MSNDEISILLRQLIDTTNSLFAKLDKTNENVNRIANQVSVLQEKESDDRSTIVRIGSEMRTCKMNCSDDIKEQSKCLSSIKNRLSKIENTSGNRGAILQWVVGAATSTALILVAFFLKK